jgi:hypothetical protein
MAKPSARVPRTIGICSSTALAVLVLGGCSGGSVGMAADATTAVQKAALTSAEAGSAKVATDVEMSVGPDSTRFVGTGLFDLTGQIGSISLQRTNATGQPDGPRLDEIVTPSALYLRGGQQGAKWGEVAAAHLADGDLISAGYTNPVLAFALLRGVGGQAGPVHYVGQSVVRGTKLAHYTGNLDLDASANAAAGPVKADLGEAAVAFSQRTIPFEVFLDAQGRACRVITHYTFPAAAPQHGQVEITSTTDLYDFGTPVSVSTPGPGDLAVPTQPAQATPTTQPAG